MFVLVPAILAVAHSVLPLFDASPRLQQPSSPLVRWDAFHFLPVADSGYTYEYQWAFFPGTPFLLRLLRFNSNPYIWPIVLLLVAATSMCSLHRLTRLHFPSSPCFARLVVLLSLLPSSPATFYFAPYAEPFFTCLSYQGMLYAAQKHWIRATFCFTLASFFRSNGILLAGYLVWGLIVEPYLIHKQSSVFKVLYSILLSICIAAPLIYHNYTAYRLFCTAEDKPEWCHRFPPSIYTHVQAKYWNNGFLRYWTLSQIPNFVIAAPPLVLLTAFSVHYIRTGFIPALKVRFSGTKNTQYEDPFAILSIVPHLIHALILCITLIFFSNTQIVLRLAAALPTLYWAAAWLLIREDRWGSMWVWWSVVWGLISVGLWAAFLPPA